MADTLTAARESAVKDLKDQGYTAQQAARMALIWYPIPSATPKRGRRQ